MYWATKASIVPRSSLLGAGQLGFWEAGGGVGQLGEGVQMGSVYRQPETEVDKSRHIWREPSKWKGTQKGAGKGSKGDAPCIYVTQCVCQSD
jgi:hypothetical protein